MIISTLVIALLTIGRQMEESLL